MADERYECPGCGKHFGSRETLQEHSEIEHDGYVAPEQAFRFSASIPDFRKYLNRSFLLGLLLGLLIAGAGFSGYLYWQSLDHRTPVPVTVVTCENCSYEEFQTATDRMFNARYDEVNYRSDRGQQLVEKYNLNYVPGFIFDREQLEKTENFKRVRPALVKFDDAYVIPDAGNMKTAQRLSTGKQLE